MIGSCSDAVLDALSAHIAVLDAEGTILRTNHSWDQFARDNSGDPERVGPGANYLALCDTVAGAQTQAAQIAEAIRNALRTGENSATIEYPCHAPGQQRWFVCRISAIAGSGLARVVVSHEDVSPVRAMEAALAAGEERLRNTFENAAVGIGLAAKDGRLYQVNREFCNITGYEASELVQMESDAITHPDDQSKDLTLKRSVSMTLLQVAELI